MPEPRRNAPFVAAALLLPLVGLAILLAQPQLDARWEHHPAHFWLVLGTAAVSAVLAYATGEAAARRGDARLSHVSLAFLSSTGFLALHALATPGVLLQSPNVGFTVATPVGVALGSLFAVRSTIDVTGQDAVREVRVARRLRWLLIIALVGWGGVSVAGLPPLGGPPAGTEGLPPLVAIPGIVLYGWSSWRYARLWQSRREGVLLAVLVAFVLLAEALVAMAAARSWHLSWWEWHVLLLAAFALVAVGARRAWHEERFAGLYLDQTVSGLRETSVLFADLQGFTSFAEDRPSEEVTAMLNEYLAAVIPAALRHGGGVDRIVGDAVMLTFNARGDEPDHAVQAVRAGLALQQAAESVVARHPDWPRFRVGINTGQATVSVLGTHGGRTHTVIGDTVNTAARIESQAPAGGVAVSASTLAALPPDTLTRPLGSLSLKGKSEPVATFLVLGLGPGTTTAPADFTGLS